MALGRRGATSGGGSDGTAFTVTWTLPSGGSAPQAGDLILLSCFLRQDARTLATPSGYSIPTNAPLISDGGEGSLHIYYKTAAGSDADPTAVAETAGYSEQYRWHTYVVSGTTPEIVDSDGTSTTDYSSAPVMPTSAAGGNTVYSVVFMGTARNTGDVTAWPSGWTEVLEEHAGGFVARTWVAENTSPGTGSVGGGGITISEQGQEKVFQLLVKEGAGAAAYLPRSIMVNQAVNRAASW